MKKFACLIFVFSLIATAACSGGSSSGDENEIEGLNPAGNDNPFGDRIPIPFPGGGNGDDPNPDPDPDPNPNPNPDPDPVPDPGPGPNPDGAPEFTCPVEELPGAIVGQFYEYTIQVEGGSGEIVFEVYRFSHLPDGFALNGDTISGTPTSAGEREFTIKIKDSRTNETKRCQFNLTIKETIKVNIRRIDQTPAEPIGDVENPGRFDFSRFIRSNRWGEIANINPQLGGTLNQPAPWDTVYEISIEGSQRGSQYTWRWGCRAIQNRSGLFQATECTQGICRVADVATACTVQREFWENVCISNSMPHIDDTNAVHRDCTAGNPPAHGETVYVWMENNLNDGRRHRLPFSVSSDFADEPAFGSLTFRFPEPPPPTPEEPENIQDRATRVFITSFTASGHGWMGTECEPVIKFCKNADGENCTRWFSLKNDFYDGRFGHGEIDWSYFSKDLLDRQCRMNDGWCLTKEHKYFSIELRRNDCGADDDWRLSRIKVEIDYADGTSHKHFDPCLNKTLLPGDSLFFTPEDTAVCAKIITGDRGDAGTDDDVFLILDESYDSDGDYDPKTSYTENEPHFIEPKEDGITMLLYWDWNEHGLFEINTYHSFSDYLHNFPFDNWSGQFKIEKAPDGEYGGWFLEGWEIFVYRPGKILNDENEKVYYDEARFQKWLHDSDPIRSDPLSTGWVALEEEDDPSKVADFSNWQEIGKCHDGCRWR